MIAELTQSGSKLYEHDTRNIPMVSVDLSRVKFLEDHLGTANGFVRAYKEKVNSNLKGKHFIVWGYGKVGSGIVRGLLHEGAQCTVVDVSSKALERASLKGANCVSPSDKNNLIQVIAQADVLVTATGVASCISQSEYGKVIADSDLTLANMGAEDEFGALFSRDRVLHSKLPFNFSLREPTLMKFLDPVFYAHNRCLQLFVEGRLQNGFQGLPPEEDLKIVTEWQTYWGEDVSEIWEDQFVR